MSLQDFWPYVTAAGSISGLLSAIYIIISKVREGPRVSLCIDSCQHRRALPSTVTMKLTIRNKGNRPTSIESLHLTAQSHDKLIKGSLSHLEDSTEAERYLTSYDTDNRPKPDRHLPLHLDGDRTIALMAAFLLERRIEDWTAQCTLEMRCTHKTITETCSSSSSPIQQP